MAAADWWDRRRFGMMIDVSMATVPAWAPIGQDASWYRAHIDGGTRDVHLHPSPLVESLHHHHERWPHVDSYDDFFPFLHFDSFDPDDWAAVARDAGMGYAVMTAKHHDGLCWWDARGTDRTVLHDGPARNVFGQFAAACERADVMLGASYSLLDWSDARYPTDRYVDEVLHPHVLDLIRRYGIAMLRGEGQWGAGSERWRSDELHAAARLDRPDLLIDDRWWASSADLVTVEHRLPSDIVEGEWEFRRPLGSSAGYNRAEPDHLLMHAPDIAALLTEVVAKGGHLMLQIGPDASGQLPESIVERLRAVGGWARRNQRLIDAGRPWTHWGDAMSRMIVVDGDLFAVDTRGLGRFGALGARAGRVHSITDDAGVLVDFDQRESGVQLRRPPRKAQRMPAVYRIELEPPPAAPIALFAPEHPGPIDLAPLLADASKGEVVQLGDGTYLGPVRVPDGVTLRGLGPDRTTIDGMESTSVTLGAGSRLEHCRLTGGGTRIGRLPLRTVVLAGTGGSIVGCAVDGHVEVAADRARVVSSSGAGVVARDVDHVEVLRSTFTGMGTDTGIRIVGGTGHQVDGCELRDHLVAVELMGTVGAGVLHNGLRARWWGVRLVDTEGTEVTGNTVERTMRAVDVDGGTGAVVTGNVARDGDSGCVLHDGASQAEVTGNFWERCRIGLLMWGSVAVRDRDNTSVELGDPDGARVSGP
jgi:alpha-L-fucosidase